MRSNLLLCIPLVILAGCTSTYALRRTGVAHKLPIDSGIYVSLAEDGRFEQTAYPHSGEMTARAVEIAFKKHVAKVERGATAETLPAAVEQARAKGRAYCVIPRILHWEDRATEWSSKPDQIEIHLMLIDVSRGETLETVTLTGKSKWATFGGDHPQDLLPKPVGEYVDSLF